MSDQMIQPLSYRPLLNIDNPDVQYKPRPGAYALIFDAQSRMLVLEEETGFFLPGGGQDPGETIVQALCRELQEELSAEVSSWQYLLAADDCRWSPFYRQHYQIQGHYFLTQLASVHGLQPEPDSVIHWLPLSEALNKLTRHNERWQVEQFIGDIRWHNHQQDPEPLRTLFAQGVSAESNWLGREGAADDLSELPQSDERFFLMRQQNRPVAAAAIKVLEQTIQITRIAVAEDVQKQGLGRTLLSYLIELFPGMHLSVLSGLQNTPALRLYQSFGFRPGREFVSEQQVPCLYLERTGTSGL